MFYVVNKNPSGTGIELYRTDYYYDDSVPREPASRCAQCGAFISLLKRVPPYRVHLETWGIGFGDIAFWMDAVLVSSRFRDTFESSGLRGLSEFLPVEVVSCRKHRKLHAEVPSYFRTMPNRGSAKIDPLASGINWGEPDKPRCDVCLNGQGVLKRWKSVVVDESTWNGDDIFYAYGIPGTLIVSSQFADWAKELDFKNLFLVNTQTSSHDFYPMES